jgi:hypothetical protein
MSNYITYIALSSKLHLLFRRECHDVQLNQKNRSKHDHRMVAKAPLSTAIDSAMHFEKVHASKIEDEPAKHHTMESEQNDVIAEQQA